VKKLLAKMEPQPDSNGIVSLGSARLKYLDAEGRYIHSENWHKEDWGPSVYGAWLAEPAVEESTWQPCFKEGRFSKAPDGVNIIDFGMGYVRPELVNGEWWWVRYRNRD